MLREYLARLPGCQTHLTRSDTASTNGDMGATLSGKTAGVTMWEFMAITKALADENRVRMLLALERQELCVCQIIELVGLAPSTVSKHMSILRQARLVDGRKEGRWMYYRLAGPGASPAVRGVIAWARKSLAHDPQVARDAQRLQAILQLDPQKLCERQCSPNRRSRGSAGKVTA